MLRNVTEGEDNVTFVDQNGYVCPRIQESGVSSSVPFG